MSSGRPPIRPPLSSIPMRVNHLPPKQHDLCAEGGLARHPYSTQREFPFAGYHKGQRFVESTLKGNAYTTATSLEGSTITPDEVYVKSWLSLPNSQYSIHYEIGFAKTCKRDILSKTFSASSSLHQINGISVLQLVASKSPFELKMQELNTVLQKKYPGGAGLMYVREFLEPTDPDFPATSIPGRVGGASHGNISLVTENRSNAQYPRAIINVSTLTREQVNRLRLLIVGERRREILISTMRLYSTIPYNGEASVVDHFESFKSSYAKTRDCRKKLDGLLAVTMALRKYSGWMYRLDRGLGRSKMVESLATRWKNLLSTRTPEELDLDTEFSYPAVLALLQDFKRSVESAPTYGDPTMLFKYEPPPTDGAQ